MSYKATEEELRKLRNKMILRSITSSSAPSPEPTLYLLDNYSDASAAFSIRKLKSTANSAFRIRRASDDTEQDIGFDSNGDLDTTSIATFCSGTTGHIKTWYDQSGNSQDCTQTTLADQPIIYQSGAVVTENSKPAIDFFEFKKLIGSTTLNINNIRSVFGVISANSNSVPSRYAAAPISSKYDDANIGYSWLNYAIGGDVPHMWIKGLNITYTNLLFANLTQHIWVNHIDDATGQVFNRLLTASTDESETLDFSSVLPFTGTNTNNFTFKIGVDSAEDGGDPYYWSGYIQEIIIFDVEQSSNETPLVTDIDTYFSVS